MTLQTSVTTEPSPELAAALRRSIIDINKGRTRVFNSTEEFLAHLESLTDTEEGPNT